MKSVGLLLGVLLAERPYEFPPHIGGEGRRRGSRLPSTSCSVRLDGFAWDKNGADSCDQANLAVEIRCENVIQRERVARWWLYYQNVLIECL